MIFAAVLAVIVVASTGYLLWEYILYTRGDI